MKTGLIPGEISVNVTRFQGNGLDDRDLSRAEIEIRKQAYCAFDFLQRYVDGFEKAIFLEVAPKLGVRETRRILGQYVLTEADVRGKARFDDAIGLCNSPVDVHEPGGSRAIMDHVGIGYGIPYPLHDAGPHRQPDHGGPLHLGRRNRLRFDAQRARLHDDRRGCGLCGDHRGARPHRCHQGTGRRYPEEAAGARRYPWFDWTKRRRRSLRPRALWAQTEKI